MACAQTGRGKTAAFMVPIVSRLLEEETMNNKAEVGTREPVHPECVVVTPTRELAKQICPDFDGKMAAGLVKVLLAAPKDVPEFIAAVAEENPAEDGEENVAGGGEDEDW